MHSLCFSLHSLPELLNTTQHYGLSAAPQIHIDALTPRWLHLEIGLWKVIKVKWGQKGRAPIQQDWWPLKERKTCPSPSPPFPSRHWGMVPWAQSQEEGLHQNPAMGAAWFMGLLFKPQSVVFCYGSLSKLWHPDKRSRGCWEHKGGGWGEHLPLPCSFI